MYDNLITYDSNGDGFIDTSSWLDESGLHYGYDTNGDGFIDQIETYSEFDEWGNPRHYEVEFDSDNNGVADTFKSVDVDDLGNVVSFFEGNDYNQDGELDMSKTFIDTSGNGEFDTVATMHLDNSDSNTVFRYEVHTDLTGDHKPDQSVEYNALDTNGDGTPDIVRISFDSVDGGYTEEYVSYEEFLAMNEMTYSTSLYGDSAVAGQFDPNTDMSKVSGDPASDMQYWEYQEKSGPCAIYAQKFAIEALTGREIPIEELIAVAEENGWYDEEQGSGTVSLNMDKLLEYYGVEHQMSFDNDVNSLEEALQNGQKIVVSVDSGQIWHGESNDIFSPETAADHAVEVIGIDRSDPNNPMVVLNDSGTPDGCGELVPLDVFENAWNAGDSQMIVCWA